MSDNHFMGRFDRSVRAFHDNYAAALKKREEEQRTAMDFVAKPDKPRTFYLPDGTEVVDVEVQP